MNVEFARRWINKRKASKKYLNFLLADLFYDGKIPKIPEDGAPLEIEEIDEESCIDLTYNSLQRPIKKKVRYLLSKPYTVLGQEELKSYLEDFLESFKTTVIELYKKGEVWWEFEIDSASPLGYKITIRKAESIVPHYTNSEKTQYDSVGYLWNKIDDQEQIFHYADFVDSEGRHRFPINGNIEETQDLGNAELPNGGKIVFKSLPFVRLQSENLYSFIKYLGKMYSDKYAQADALLRDNADPIAVVKNASETDSQIFMEDLRRDRLVKVEGTGDFSFASNSMDYSSIESFMKMLKSDMADLVGVVSREQELSYVTSGRAIDRLYLDMDSDAADMGQVLKSGVKAFLTFIQTESGKDYLSDFDIVFNTDKPTDEASIIQNINSSSELLSKRTLLEQHPWVEDVDKELKQIEEETEKQSSQDLMIPFQDSMTETPLPPVEGEEKEEVVDESAPKEEEKK